MIPNSLFGITAIACFTLPIFIILYFRLYKHVSLIALMVYYALIILHCFSSNTVPPAPDLQNTWEVLFNYIEIPLMLSALLFFCPAKQKRQKIHFIISFFLAYEVLVAAFHGFSAAASLYVMVPGLLVIVLYSLFLFLRQVRFTVTHGKNWGRVLMLGSLLFSYSCYLFMFYAYFFQQQSNVAGIYSVHFFSSAIAAVLMSAGLYLMRHRIRDLQELKVTRRELQMVFGG
jgi:peptidoglycan/LPS O-acetylase OafA/YrhL